MVMLDTNIILRYLLNDNEQMADEAEEIIKGYEIRTFDKKLQRLLQNGM